MRSKKKTDLRVIEDGFRKNEAKLCFLLEKIEDGITLSDAKGHFYVYNSAMERITGYTKEEANASLDFLELIYPDPIERKRALFGIVELQEGMSREGEVTIVRKDGRPARIIINSYLTNYSGHDIFLSIYRDVTEHKQFEETQRARKFAEAANRAKSEFLANMSHELRTPLNSIIGFAEILHDQTFGPLNDKQKEYINYVLSSGKYLLSLINDILDLGKVESGKMELKPSVFSLKNLLEGSLVLVKERAFRGGIELSLDIADGIDRMNADERKVKEIVYNLLSNAVKFTPRGGRAGIRARKLDSIIEIQVWDTGIGIESKDRGKIFSGFFQLDDKYEGFGLGLMIAKKLVELHGGRIWVESGGKGKGSTFKLTLPANPQPKSQS